MLKIGFIHFLYFRWTFVNLCDQCQNISCIGIQVINILTFFILSTNPHGSLSVHPVKDQKQNGHCHIYCNPFLLPVPQ